MKKLRMLVFLIILAFSFSVKAEVLLQVNCSDSTLSINKSAVCEGTLLYGNEGVNDIEFNYQTNLDITFSSFPGFTITDDSNKIIIHSDNTLYDEALNAIKLFSFSLKVNDHVLENEILLINNIRINKENEINVNDISKEFNISKEVIKQDDTCTLESISVDKEIIKGFKKDQLEYRGITVTNRYIFIDAKRSSEKSSVMGLGNVKVPNGETIERKITVKAEDGTERVYKLFITNIAEKEEINIDDLRPDEKEKSNDNTLKLFELYQDNQKMDIKYDNSKFIYNIDINEKTDKLTIKAVLNDTKATFINNFGPRDIKINYGYNKELIKIKAENGEERVITLNINYIDNRSNDNSLSSLIINGVVVDLTKDKLEIRLPSNTLKTIIEAIPNNNMAIVKYEDIDLSVGDNEVNILVTSETAETKEYRVNVIKEEQVIFNNITITNYNLAFNKDIKNYDLKINNDTNKLNIIINPNVVKYEILNNDNLKNGSKIIIKVTDDINTYEYSIKIIKESNTLINIICYLVFGIGVISLIMSIISVKKKHCI